MEISSFAFVNRKGPEGIEARKNRQWLSLSSRGTLVIVTTKPKDIGSSAILRVKSRRLPQYSPVAISFQFQLSCSINWNYIIHWIDNNGSYTSVVTRVRLFPQHVTQIYIEWQVYCTTSIITPETYRVDRTINCLILIKLLTEFLS